MSDNAHWTTIYKRMKNEPKKGQHYVECSKCGKMFSHMTHFGGTRWIKCDHCKQVGYECFECALGDEYREENVYYSEEIAIKRWGECCEDCNDVHFEKTYPAHTAYLACINLKCKCHMKNKGLVELKHMADEEGLTLRVFLKEYGLEPDPNSPAVKLIKSMHTKHKDG